MTDHANLFTQWWFQIIHLTKTRKLGSFIIITKKIVLVINRVIFVVTTRIDIPIARKKNFKNLCLIEPQLFPHNSLLLSFIFTEIDGWKYE